MVRKFDSRTSQEQDTDRPNAHEVNPGLGSRAIAGTNLPENKEKFTSILIEGADFDAPLTTDVAELHTLADGTVYFTGPGPVPSD